MLRSPKPRANKEALNTRIDAEIEAYYRSRAGKARGALTDMVESALRTQMVLDQQLGSRLEDLREYAKAHGLNPEDEGFVLAHAVLAALDSQDSRRRK
jgi:hypothetical protein